MRTANLHQQPYSIITRPTVLLFSLLFASVTISTAVAQTAVQADPVRMVKVADTEPVLGRWISLQSGTVVARVAAAVQSVKVNAGDELKKGQLIATLDAESIRARHQLAKADLTELKASRNAALAQRKLAQTELGRLVRLKNSPAFIPSMFDRAEQELAAAKAQLGRIDASMDRARAQMQLSKIDLRNTRITAPYPGLVLERMANPGDWAQPGSAMVRMVDTEKLELEAAIPVNRISNLRAGQQLAVTLDNQTSIQATVRAILRSENTAARTQAVRLSVASIPADVAIAQPVSIAVPTSSKSEVLTVHKDAIGFHKGMAIVFIAVDGQAQPRPVKLGRGIGNRYEVKSGLANGDLAVVRGNENLFPNAPITVTP